MANDPIKISEMGQIPVLAAGDLVPVVDVSASTPAAENKYLLLSQLLTWLESGLTIPTVPELISQAEAEAGTATTTRLWTAQRVAQAIAELAPDPVALPEVISQAEAEAGTSTTERLWTAQRVAQAIAELETTGGGVTLPADVTQAEAEAGTETTARTWSPLRVAQAIAELAPDGGGSSDATNPAVGVASIYLQNGVDVHRVYLDEGDGGTLFLRHDPTPES